ncbi:MAG: response regulator, partial [Phaeodactylibacter sp.]|nr:response regulator [Phaeodactylibacter sp.]
MLPIRNEAKASDAVDARSADTIADAIDPVVEPATAPAYAGPSPAVAASARRGGMSLRSTSTDSPLVLIIEDNADVTEYIISCLDKDYALQTARNGREGVEKALEIVPDVILSDVMMPEMDGFEVCRILKSSRATSHIPIVLLTAKATQEDKVAGLSQGADAYLTKPFDKEELLVRLKNLAAVSQRLRERLSEAPAGGAWASEQEQQEAAFLRELTAIIEANLGDEDFDTTRLCRAVALGRTQLHNKLKALTGTPTATFIRSVRLRKAKALLESTDLPIGDIAAQVGYKDFSHFSRSFGKEFGMSPSEVRKT